MDQEVLQKKNVSRKTISQQGNASSMCCSPEFDEEDLCRWWVSETNAACEKTWMEFSRSPEGWQTWSVLKWRVDATIDDRKAERMEGIKGLQWKDRTIIQGGAEVSGAGTVVQKQC